jgi:hypothetical protein
MTAVEGRFSITEANRYGNDEDPLKYCGVNCAVSRVAAVYHSVSVVRYVPFVAEMYAKIVYSPRGSGAIIWVYKGARVVLDVRRIHVSATVPEFSTINPTNKSSSVPNALTVHDGSATCRSMKRGITSLEMSPQLQVELPSFIQDLSNLVK